MCVYFFLRSIIDRFKGFGLIFVVLSIIRQRDWGEGFFKGIVILKVFFFRRLERDRGKIYIMFIVIWQAVGFFVDVMFVRDDFFFNFFWSYFRMFFFFLEFFRFLGVCEVFLEVQNKIKGGFCNECFFFIFLIYICSLRFQLYLYISGYI